MCDPLAAFPPTRWMIIAAFLLGMAELRQGY
jgi:hypothetical protein